MNERGKSSERNKIRIFLAIRQSATLRNEEKLTNLIKPNQSMAPISLPLNLNFKVTASATNLPELPDKIRNSKVLVLGGTGRVGGSTATALSNFCPDLRIIVAGRNR